MLKFKFVYSLFVGFVAKKSRSSYEKRDFHIV